MDNKDQRRFHAANERFKVVNRPALITERAGVDFREGLRADPDQRSVRRRSRDECRRHVAVCPGFVLDDNRLTQRLAHMIGDDPSVGIERPARRRTHDEPDRARAVVRATRSIAGSRAFMSVLLATDRLPNAAAALSALQPMALTSITDTSRKQKQAAASVAHSVA